MLKDDLSVVIICYDPYKDAIDFNPYFFEKYWPNCTLNVTYVTSEMDVSTKHAVVKTNGDLSYCQRLSAALSTISTRYVLLLLDDYFIDSTVDETLIERVVRVMKETALDYCELYTMFDKPNGKRILLNDMSFVKISRSRKYRITLQPSVFSVGLLNQLLEMNPKSAWEAELCFMDKRFDKIDAYFSLDKPFSITNYIDKGLVTKKGYKMLKNNGLWQNQRAKMTTLKTIKNWLIRKLYRFVPKKLKDKIKGNDIIYRG